MRFLHRLGLGTLLAMLLIGILPVSGQDIPERISLTAGGILEIGIDTKLNRPEFSWILTKEREFIAAQRSKFFQTRPTIPGTYTLDVSVQNEEHTLSEFHTFAIDVTEAGMQPAFPSLGSGSAMPVVQFDPPESSRSISLNPQGGILKIDASMSTGIDRFDIDLDGSDDSNGDGNPLNDADNSGSASQQSGGPLYYYFLPSNEPRIIGLTMIDRQNTPMQTQYSIGFNGRSSSGPIVPQGGNIEISSQIQGLAVRFSADVNPLLLSGRSVLYEWDFGDHQKSLLKNPVHRYSAPGTYTVQLAIRDLQNGQIVYGGTTQVSLTETAEPIPEPEPEPSDGGTTFGTYLKIGTIFIGLLALGLIAYFLLRKVKDMTSGRIQKKLEEVEGKLFDPSKKPDVLAAPAPLVLKKESPPPIATQKTEQGKQEVVDREKSQTEFKAAKEQPIADQTGPVPAWLKPTTSEAKPAVQPAPPPTAPPAPKPPEPQPKPQTPATVPPPKPPAPFTPPPSPSPQPAPQPTPVTPPPSPPAAKPVAPTPPIQTTTVSNPTIEPKTIPATPESKILTPDEREAERKRKKRQRYRHNKRLREKESKDATPAQPIQPEQQVNDSDAPIAIIRADSLEDQNEPKTN